MTTLNQLLAAQETARTETARAQHDLTSLSTDIRRRCTDLRLLALAGRIEARLECVQGSTTTPQQIVNALSDYLQSPEGFDTAPLLEMIDTAKQNLNDCYRSVTA